MLNPDNINLKQEVEKLKKLEGKERGEDIIYLVNYAEEKEGEVKTRSLEAELARAGFKTPDITKVGPMEWIPASIPTIYMLGMIKVFGWRDKEIFEMGWNLVSFSPILKIFIKYFISPKKTMELAARNWKRHYSFGDVRVVEYDKTKKTLAIRLYKFKKIKATCVYFKGVFSRVVGLAVGSPDIDVKETKCIFDGDPYHEFVFNWR